MLNAHFLQHVVFDECWERLPLLHNMVVPIADIYVDDNIGLRLANLRLRLHTAPNILQKLVKYKTKQRRKNA